jgi:hypothetical protein
VFDSRWGLTVEAFRDRTSRQSARLLRETLGVRGPLPEPLAPSAGSAARSSKPGRPSPILGGGSEVSVVKLDITQVSETWVPDPNSGGGTNRPCSLLARTVPSHGTEPRSILGRVTIAPIDHWLDHRAFNPEKADRNRLGVCPHVEIGNQPGLRNLYSQFESG